jgi:hypothetical protein
VEINPMPITKYACAVCNAVYDTFSKAEECEKSTIETPLQKYDVVIRSLPVQEHYLDLESKWVYKKIDDLWPGKNHLLYYVIIDKRYLGHELKLELLSLAEICPKEQYRYDTSDTYLQLVENIPEDIKIYIEKLKKKDARKK